MLNLWQVESFLAVVETGSFVKAAERLGRAQPTVSQQVRKLEDDLATRLLHRGRDRCVATEAGRRFLRHARPLLALAARSREAIRSAPLRIGASSNIGTYLLPPILRRFAAMHETGTPCCDVQIASNPRIADRLAHGEHDIALLEWWEARDGYAATPWRPEPLVMITAPGHRWSARRRFDVTALSGVALLAGEAGSGTATAIREAAGRDGVTLAVSLTLGSTEAVKRAVIEGLGISIVLAGSVETEVSAGRLCAIPLVRGRTPVCKRLLAVTPDSPEPGPFARDFVALLSAA